MINVHSKIIQMLNESELFLFSILLNYGKESRPKNSVLLSKTGWGLKKLQVVKNSLVDKGLLQVNQMFTGTDGRRLGSNEYRIITQLASKYNGKKELETDYLKGVCMVHIDMGQNDIRQIDLRQNDMGNFEVGHFGGDFKVLKVIIIESKELLNKESIEKENPLLLEFEKLKAENEKLKEQLAKKKPKKIDGVISYPSTFSPELTKLIESFFEMRKSIGKPFKLLASKQTRVDTLAKDVNIFGIENVMGAIQNSIDNEYQGIFVKDWADKNKGNKKPIVKQEFPYPLPNFANQEHRQMFFLTRYTAYTPYLENRLVNTEYRQQALIQKDAETLCKKLELENPRLAQLEVKQMAYEEF